MTETTTAAPAQFAVNQADIDKMTEALAAYRGYEWWFRTENPMPGSRCLSPLVLQNMKTGYEDGSIMPTIPQFKNLVTTAMFYQQKCRVLMECAGDDVVGD